MQFVTRLPDSLKTEVKGVNLFRGSWYKTAGSPDLPFTLNRSMAFPTVFKLWDLYVIFICRCMSILCIFFSAGKIQRGRLVNWVEKVSFKNIQKLLEISKQERHHECNTPSR